MYLHISQLIKLITYSLISSLVRLPLYTFLCFKIFYGWTNHRLSVSKCPFLLHIALILCLLTSPTCTQDVYAKTGSSANSTNESAQFSLSTCSPCQAPRFRSSFIQIPQSTASVSLQCRQLLQYNIDRIISC